jgi:hypothetical protein
MSQEADAVSEPVTSPLTVQTDQNEADCQRKHPLRPLNLPSGVTMRDYELFKKTQELAARVSVTFVARLGSFSSLC